MEKLSLEQLHRVDVNTFRTSEKIPVRLVLDNVRSALNVGSLFRTGDAFMIQDLYLTGITATPPNKEISKTAIGATDSVQWQYFKDIVLLCQQMKAEGWILVGVEQTTESIPLQDFKPDTTAKYALILGNEVEGIQEDLLPLLNHAIEIPQFGTKHSLNVAVCGGIVMWHFLQSYKKW